MICSMRGGAMTLTLVRGAGRDGVDRGAHIVELGGRHLPLVRQAEDEACGIAHVEAKDAAAEQAVGAVHMREFGERGRSEEHTSELQSLMRISYAVFCLKKKKKSTQ